MGIDYKVKPMSRPKKDYCAISIKLDANINKELIKYCEKTRYTKTAVVELALEEYLKLKKINK